jgi:segregation and condensation protein B
MGIQEDKRVLEAALYATDRPLGFQEIKRLLGTSSDTYVQKLIEELKGSYRRRDGPFSLEERGQGAFNIYLKEDIEEKLGGIVPKLKLSKGALKTLALIAYKQNLTLAKLAELRGSRTYEYVRQLVALKFVASRPFGRTRQLRTTEKFASYFGLPDDMDLIREWIELRMQ